MIIKYPEKWTNTHVNTSIVQASCINYASFIRMLRSPLST